MDKAPETSEEIPAEPVSETASEAAEVPETEPEAPKPKTSERRSKRYVKGPKK